MERTFSIVEQELEHGLGLGPGCNKTLQDVVNCAKHPAHAFVVLGSITTEPRYGYPDAWVVGDHSSANSLSMPNPGIDETLKKLPEMLSICEENDKLLIVSVAGFFSRDFASLVYKLAEAGVRLIELNGGCPNTRDDEGREEPIVSYHPEVLAEVIKLTEEELGTTSTSPNLSIKVSPLPPHTADDVIEVIRPTSVKVISTMNTLPGGLPVNEDGEEVFDHFGGLAGISGPGMFWSSLGQMKKLRDGLPDREFIFTNGVGNGKQAAIAHKVGANIVQCVTAWYKGTYERVFEEYVDEMDRLA